MSCKEEKISCYGECARGCLCSPGVDEKTISHPPPSPNKYFRVAVDPLQTSFSSPQPAVRGGGGGWRRGRASPRRERNGFPGGVVANTRGRERAWGACGCRPRGRRGGRAGGGGRPGGGPGWRGGGSRRVARHLPGSRGRRDEGQVAVTRGRGGVRAARPGNAASALPRVSSPRVGRGAAGKEGGAGLGAGPREGLGASRGLRGGFAGVSAERRSRG